MVWLLPALRDGFGVSFMAVGAAEGAGVAAGIALGLLVGFRQPQQPSTTRTMARNVYIWMYCLGPVLILVAVIAAWAQAWEITFGVGFICCAVLVLWVGWQPAPSNNVRRRK